MKCLYEIKVSNKLMDGNVMKNSVIVHDQQYWTFATRIQTVISRL